MSDDWQVGDLALCVALTLPPPRKLAPSRILRLGAIYSVCSIRWSVTEQCVAIGLNEARSRGEFGDWHSAVFIKVTPHEADEFDRETIALMNGAPILEPTNHTPRRNADAHHLSGAGVSVFHEQPNTLGEAQDHV